MKIENNGLGNYNLSYLRDVQQQSKTSVQSDKTENNEEIKKDIQPKKEGAITKDEKGFFLKLYPESAKDIIAYHFYEKGGKMSGVSVGSLFDKRG